MENNYSKIGNKANNYQEYKIEGKKPQTHEMTQKLLCSQIMLNLGEQVRILV